MIIMACYIEVQSVSLLSLDIILKITCNMFISIIYLNNDIWHPLRLAYMLFVYLFVSNPCIPTFPLGRHMVLRLPHCGLCFARPPGGTIWLGVHTYYVVYSTHNEFGCVCAYKYAYKAVCIQSDNWRNWIVPWPWISGAVNEILKFTLCLSVSYWPH